LPATRASSVTLDAGDGQYSLRGDVIVDGDTAYLFEWVTYRVIASVREGEEPSLVVGDSRYEDVITVGGGKIFVAEFNLGNRVGVLHLRILSKDREVPLRFRRFEVISEKVVRLAGLDPKTSDPDEVIRAHKDYVKALTDELIKAALELPFTVKAPTGFDSIKSWSSPSPLFAYHFLLSNSSKILSTYEAILRKPKRSLLTKREWVEPWAVSTVDHDLILGISQHPEYLVRVEEGCLAVVRDAQGNAYAPLKLRHAVKQVTYDTPENRFAKHFLKELIVHSINVLKLPSIPRENMLKLLNLKSRLLLINAHPVMSEVRDSSGAIHVTQAMLKQEGYRDLLRLWMTFKSRAPFIEGLDEAIRNKDIAKLYEYWCFFKLTKELTRIFGKGEVKLTITPAGEIPENGEAMATYAEGWRLHYNKPIKGYSVMLRPDYSLYRGNTLVGVLDAKFRFDAPTPQELGHISENQGSEEHTTPETRAKLDDIYKMHTYKDALNAKFAIILYPGDKNAYYPESRNATPRKPSNIAELIQTVIKEPGIGYVSLRPPRRKAQNTK